MSKRWILIPLILTALLTIFLTLPSRKHQPLFQPPLPLNLSVHQQSLKFKVEEALPVDLDGDERTELVIRETPTKRIYLAQWQGSRWTIKPLPIPSSSSLPTNFIPRFDTGLIPEDTMRGKKLLKFSDLKCLPVLLPNRRVVILRRDRKGFLKSQNLVSNACFMLVWDLDSDGKQNDLIIGVLPKRLLWFVAEKNTLSLRQEINALGSGKTNTWGQVEEAYLSSYELWISLKGGTYSEWYVIWRNRWTPAPTNFGAIKHGDFDGDGILDYAGIDLNSRTLQVWLSKSRKVFKPPFRLPLPSAFELAIGDLDNDGLVEVLIRDGNKLVCWEMLPSGKFKSVTLQKRGLFDVLGFGDFDNDGQTEMATLYRDINPVLSILDWVLQQLSLKKPPLPDLFLVRKTTKGWEWRTVKIFSTKSRRRGYKIKASKFWGFYSTELPNSGVCCFGGRWWLFVSANTGATPSCFLCRLKDILGTLRGRYINCPHGHNEFWQETRFWSVKGDKAIEALRVDGILAHEFKFRDTPPKGVDLDGDGKEEAVLTRTIGNNAVFVARYRNERWEVGKVERPCRLVSLSLSSKPRPCLIAVWEDGTITQISVPSKR